MFCKYTVKTCNFTPKEVAAKLILLNTVNSENFARVLFSRNFAYAKFREYKILVKWRN